MSQNGGQRFNSGQTSPEADVRRKTAQTGPKQSEIWFPRYRQSFWESGSPPN
jgi:hypothetical protein